jgi:hypothetical protein
MGMLILDGAKLIMVFLRDRFWDLHCFYYLGNVCFLLSCPEARFLSYSVRRDIQHGPDRTLMELRTLTDSREQIRTDQEADLKGPADQEGAPRTYTIEDT